MADPLRNFYTWPGASLRASQHRVLAGQIFRRDGLSYATYMIAKHELSVWYEPNWRNARILASHFPHCTICSIPEESTISRHRVPAWRKRRTGGIL